MLNNAALWNRPTTNEALMMCGPTSFARFFLAKIVLEQQPMTTQARIPVTK